MRQLPGTRAFGRPGLRRIVTHGSEPRARRIEDQAVSSDPGGVRRRLFGSISRYDRGSFPRRQIPERCSRPLPIRRLPYFGLE